MQIEQILKNRHQSLYLNEIVDLRNKVKLFGFHFASLDIRQDSRIHNQVFEAIVSHPKIQEYTSGLPENYLALSLEERLQIAIDNENNEPHDPGDPIDTGDPGAVTNNWADMVDEDNNV